MKALIVSNCNGAAYYGFMKHFFPDWDVRSVVHSQAKIWISDKNEPFLNYLKEAEIFVGDPLFLRNEASDLFSSSIEAFNLPGFVYDGSRPDCFWIPSVLSPTGAGYIHSKIVASAFCLGKTVDETEALFSKEHFRNLGYFDAHSRSLQKLFKTYDRYSGMDIRPLFEVWWKFGDFMYTPNHPRSFVPFDLISNSLSSRGYLNKFSEESIASARRDFDDTLGRGMIWPVYPEIAREIGVISPTTYWRESIDKGSGKKFLLRAMIERSFKTYEATTGFREAAEKSLGGPNSIEAYGGETSNLAGI